MRAGDAGDYRAGDAGSGKGIMANHKRKKPKSGRSGCLMCKAHKHQAWKDTLNCQTLQERRARVSEKEQRSESGG